MMAVVQEWAAVVGWPVVIATALLPISFVGLVILGEWAR